MVESKPSGQEMPHKLHPPANNFLEVEDVTKMLAESIRNSFLVRDLDQEELDRVAESLEEEGMDSNSIRLKDTPVTNNREFASKRGLLEMDDKDVNCCILGFSSEKPKKMCKLDQNVFSVETRKESPFFLNFDTVNLEAKRINQL